MGRVVLSDLVAMGSFLMGPHNHCCFSLEGRAFSRRRGGPRCDCVSTRLELSWKRNVNHVTVVSDLCFMKKGNVSDWISQTRSWEDSPKYNQQANHIFVTKNLYQKNAKKTKPRFGECYTCFGFETETGVVVYFGYFSRYVYVQSYYSKGLGESFSLMWLNIGLHWKLPKYKLPFLVLYQTQV